jgi:hypothetical protein
MKTLIFLIILLSIPFTFNCDWGREKVIGETVKPDWKWAKERMKFHGTLVAEYKDGDFYFCRNGKKLKLW